VRRARSLVRPAALLVALAATTLAHADAGTLYVIEQLVVNVNSAPDASGERIATVKSGEKLEVIERAGEQVHVKLANGHDGWIRAGYLTADEPLRARLTERETQVAQLQEEVSRLQAQLAAPHASSAPAAPAGGAAASEDPAPAAPAALFNTPTEQSAHRVWPWALGAVLLGLAVGFVLGALVLDRHIRRKYGGLRIY
jgi:hypothetical protein